MKKWYEIEPKHLKLVWNFSKDSKPFLGLQINIAEGVYLTKSFINETGVLDFQEEIYKLFKEIEKGEDKNE